MPEWVFSSSAHKKHFAGLCFKPAAEQIVRLVALVSEGPWALGRSVILNSSCDCPGPWPQHHSVTLVPLQALPFTLLPWAIQQAIQPLTHGSHVPGISGLLLSPRGYLSKQGAREDLLIEPLGEAGPPERPCLLQGLFLSSSHTSCPSIRVGGRTTPYLPGQHALFFPF